MLISARRALKRLSGTKTIILKIIRIVAIITVRHLQTKINKKVNKYSLRNEEELQKKR